ncbi:MAG: LPS-assembly protein LptD [Phenylobacterium sp.]
MPLLSGEPDVRAPNEVLMDRTKFRAWRLIVLLATVALTHAAPALAAPPPEPAGDGLRPDQLYLEADSVTRDAEKGRTTARGNVQVRYQGRTLSADEVTFEAASRLIRAKGNVRIVNPDRTAQFADEVVLDQSLSVGAAVGFSARSEGDIKIAAASAVRRSEAVNELNRAIFTPCEVCAKSGEPKDPTWSIQAERITQDRARQVVVYRNAVIRVRGAPVLYVPVFWHADPQAERSSGFLTPDVRTSGRRGFSYEQPYLFVLSPSADLTLSPQFNSRVAPFLNAHFRQRFRTGAIDVRGGFTHDRDFDGKGNAFGEPTARSYILASGAFALTPEWRWGFSAERASDDLVFEKYDVGGAFVARGPFVADDRRLTSQIYATRQAERSWFSIGAFSIQGLRREDDDRTFPTVAPFIEGRFEPTLNLAGGRLRLRTSAVALTRDTAPNAPAGTPGLDSRRVTFETDWRRAFVSPSGLRIDGFGNIRMDGYSLNDIEGVAGRGSTKGRALASAGADVSFPLARRIGEALVVIEPTAQVIASAGADLIRVGRTPSGVPIYLNEDSATVIFDETSLFRLNRLPGYDLADDGLRLSLAGRASVLWDDGRRATFLLGRSFRANETGLFPTTSGLSRKASDWIVSAEVAPMKGVSLFSRVRLDGENLDVRRAEAGGDLNLRRGGGYIRYLREETGPVSGRRENIDFGGEYFLSDTWGLSVYGNRDIAAGAWVIRDVGVVYRDDCTRLDVFYRQEDLQVGRLGSSSSVNIRLTLATLGGPLARR